jgi:cytosine deaminase
MRLSNARLEDGRMADVVVEHGRIAAIVPHDPAVAGEALEGRLLLPALVDGHVHLDKTLLGLPWRPNSDARDVQGRIAHERAARGELALPVEVRAANLLRRMIAWGTTALRTHVDIDEMIGLGNFHAVMAAIAPFRDVVDIQVVAFPQSGIVTRPGVAELLDAALAEGADLVGGLDPLVIDGDVAAHLDVVFGLAAKHGKGIDIHLHDIGPAGNAQLREIAARSLAASMQRRVTVSHAFSLGTSDAADFAATTDALALGGVSILTSSPSAVPAPPVKALRGRGVVIHAGSDNIRDLWSPFGNGDMIERATLIALRQGFRSDADLALAYDLCSDAAALGLPARGVAVGMPADLVAVAAGARAEAVAERPGRRMVFKAGRRLA